MKKLIATVTLSVCLLGLTGCSRRPYRLPQDRFCYSADNAQVIALTAFEREYAIDLMNNATWKEDTGHCDSDYIFYTQRREVRYHALCGTFHDLKTKKSTALTLEQRDEMNKMLGFVETAPKKTYKVELSHKNCIVNELNSEYAPGQEITAVISPITEHGSNAYVNGVMQKTKLDGRGGEYFTFIMPCEDVLIEVEYTGRWGFFPF